MPGSIDVSMAPSTYRSIRMADRTLLLSQWFRHRGCTTRRHFRSLSLPFSSARMPFAAVAGSFTTQPLSGLKPAELEGVLAHEVLHCALANHCQRGQREPEMWNEAADYAVNPILLGSGVVLPAGVLVDPAFADLSAEEIYARL